MNSRSSGLHRTAKPFFLTVLLCSALLSMTLSPLARAQDVKLDSLWGRFVGNINTMLFTPDSKQLLIADDVGLIRVFDAQTGERRDSFPNRYGCTEMKLSIDGKLLFVANMDGIDIISTTTWKAVDSLPLPQLNGSELGHFYFDVSPDGKYLVIKKFLAGEVNTNDYYRMWVYSYPQKEQLWQKDVIAYDVKMKYGFPTGKIVFSADGKYIIGEEGFALKQWQWQNNDQTGEIIVDALPIAREDDLLAFSPDRKYFTLRGEGIWNIELRQKVIIENAGYPSSSTTFTSDGLYAIWDKSEIIEVFHIPSAKKVYSGGMYAGITLLSPDNTLLAYQFATRGMQLNRVNWKTTSIEDRNFALLRVVVSPLPSNEQTDITVTTSEFIPLSVLTITDIQGRIVKEVFNGSLHQGKNSFLLDNNRFSSGNYFLNLQYGTHIVTESFIITK